MRTFLAVAASLTLASGVMLVAAGSGQKPGEKQKVITKTEGPAVWVSDDDQAMRGEDDPLVRRLAVLEGRGVELGVTIQDLDAKQQASSSGALVDSVREESAAAKAGIKKGDIITEFDGEHVRGARHLSRLVAETPEGRTVKAALLRDGKRIDLSLTPESGAHAGRRIEREFEFKVPSPDMFAGRPGDEWMGPESRKFFYDVRPPNGGGPDPWAWAMPRHARLGVSIQELTPQLAEYFGTKDGVLVTSVEPDTPAAKAGLKAGDVIISINGKTVNDGGRLIEAVQSADDGAEVTVGYVRDKKSATAKATLEPKEKEKIERRIQPI